MLGGNYLGQVWVSSSAAGTWTRAVADALTAAVDSAPVRLLVLSRSASDALTAALDSAPIRVLGLIRSSVAEALTPAADAVGRRFIGARSVADTLTAANESVARLGVFVRLGITDALTAATDAVASLKGSGIAYLRSAADTLTAATDAVSRASTSVRLAAETLTLSEVVARVATFPRAASDALGAATDGVSKALGSVRLATDALTAAIDSAPVRLLVAGRSLADALSGTTDAVSLASRALLRAVVESSVTTEIVSRGIINPIRQIAETLTTTDVIVRDAGRFVKDVMTAATDSLKKGFAVLVADALTAAVDALGSKDSGRAVNEIVSAYDFVTRVKNASLAILRSVTETLSATDSPSRLVTLSRSTADVLAAATDRASKTGLITLAATVSFVGTLGKISTKTFTAALSFTGALTKGLIAAGGDLVNDLPFASIVTTSRNLVIQAFDRVKTILVYHPRNDK